MSRFGDMNPDETAALQAEFEHSATSRERRVELLMFLQEGADEAKIGRQCPRCKHFPFYAPHHEALLEGHVYSRDGMAELRITGYCEFCFDLITEEPDEEDEDAWKQRAIASDIGALAEAMGPDTTVRRLSDEEARARFFEEPSPYHPRNRARVQDLDDGLLPPL